MLLGSSSDFYVENKLVGVFYFSFSSIFGFTRLSFLRRFLVAFLGVYEIFVLREVQHRGYFMGSLLCFLALLHFIEC